MKANENPVLSRLWAFAIWAVVIFFVVNLLAMIATVVVNSLSTRWLGTWLPPGYTTRWYYSAWREFQLDEVLVVTFQIAGAVALWRRYLALENTGSRRVEVERLLAKALDTIEDVVQPPPALPCW